jgi:hypothetical protein
VRGGTYFSWLYPDLPTHKWNNDELSSSSAGVSECA